MKPSKIIVPIIAVAAVSVSSFVLTGCGLFDSEAQRTFKKFVPEITKQYDSITWDMIDNASAYDVYCNGKLKETVKDNVYTVGDELKEDSTYYIVAHSDELKRDTQKSNDIVYYKNTNFDTGESLKVSGSSTVTVSNNIRQLVFDGYSGSVSLDIADRTADLVVSLKNSSLSSGLNFVPDEGKNEYTVILEIDGNVKINGKNGKSYTAADKGATNSEIDGKRGGDGETAIRAKKLVIKGDGNLTLKGGNGGNASEGADSTGLFSTKYCGKGASGGNGGNGITCDVLMLKLDQDKLSASGGTGGKKSSPGANGAGISGPIITAAWFNWDIGKDGANGVATSVNKYIVLDNKTEDDETEDDEPQIATETLTINSSSTVKVPSNVGKLVFDGYIGSVSLDIADRKAELVVSLKNSHLTSGLSFVPANGGSEYKVVIIIDGDVNIIGRDGKSYISADKGATNSEIDGKPGGDGETAIRAKKLVIKGDGNLILKGGNGGNASEGADSEGSASVMKCGKGASGGNGGCGIDCDTLTLDIGAGNKLTATAGTGGKKSSPGANGAGISGPIITASWSEWDIGVDGTNGSKISVSEKTILSGIIE